jgi:3-isopropylmalate dehydrogenase
MLLGWLGERHGKPAFAGAQAALEAALAQLFKSPATRTRDLGGNLGTLAFTQAVLDNLR